MVFSHEFLLIFIRCLTYLVFAALRISNSVWPWLFLLHHKRTQACCLQMYLNCSMSLVFNLFISVSCIIYRNGRAFTSKSYLFFSRSFVRLHTQSAPPIAKIETKPTDWRERKKRNVGMKVRWKMRRTPNAMLVAGRDTDKKSKR